MKCPECGSRQFGYVFKECEIREYDENDKLLQADRIQSDIVEEILCSGCNQIFESDEMLIESKNDESKVS